MAEQDIQNVATQIQRLSNIYRVLGVNEAVQKFTGEPAKFKNWIISIEKYAFLTKLKSDEIKLVAYQASDHVVSDFIRRRLKVNSLGTWEQLKEELGVMFSGGAQSACY